MNHDAIKLDVEAEERVDVLVIGGGIAGVCAAIACARNGVDTALIEMDPCLGGNSSPLLGVHVSGAHSFHPYASETGIIEELELQAAWLHAKTRTHGQHYNISTTWHLLLMDALRDAGVRVYLNHQGRQATVENRRVTAVVAIDTEHLLTRRFRIRHGMIEASGDGVVARTAGAATMRGTESRDTFGERSGKNVASTETMGTSITALVKKCRQPVEFAMPPRFARRAAAEGPPAKLGAYPSSWNPDDECCFLWVTESGGQRDTVRDAAEIREEILYQLYRTWDNVKHISFPEQARHWELVWVSPKCGKRESFRFVGDTVLTQTHVEQAAPFEDSIGYGGYGVDIHEPVGERARVRFYSIPPLWNFPYRSCYSRDLDNLWLAGRLMSVSHLALGTVRLMRTLGAIGQGVGTAAALACHHGCTAAEVGRRHLHRLRQTLLRQDATILNLRNQDAHDLARTATVSATSESAFGATRPSSWTPLDRPSGIQLWHWREALETVQFHLRNSTPQPRELTLTLQLYRAETPWKAADDFVRPRHLAGSLNRMEWGYENRVDRVKTIAAAQARIEGRFEGWCTFSFDPPPTLIPVDPTSDENHYNLILAPCDDVFLGVDDHEYDGSLGITLDEREDAYTPTACGPAFNIDPAPRYGEAANVIDGHHRRYSTNPVHMWLSDPEAALPQSLDLEFHTDVDLTEVRLTFDTIERAYRDSPINADKAAAGRCVREYTLQALTAAGWIQLAHERENYQRLRSHRFRTTRCGCLRLTVMRMNDGSSRARVYEVRAYGDGTTMA